MSRTITIPGGTAELFDKVELTPRRQLPLKRLFLRAGDLMVKLAAASKVTSPDGEVEEAPELTGEEVILTEHEAEILSLIQYATSWAYLKSWTLPLPLPQSPDDLLDIPNEINEAIDAEVSRLNRGLSAAAQFEPSDETLEDETSFTGNSEGSATL